MAAIDLTRIKYYVTAILADGRRLSLENVAEVIAWEENENELSTRLNLTIRDIPGDKGRLSKQLALCTIIYLYADWGAGKKEIFRGTIWDWEHSQIKDDPIYVTCYDLLYNLQKSSDFKYYTSGMTTKSIIADIFDTWAVDMGVYTAPNLAHQKTLYKSRPVASMLTDTLLEARRLGGGEAIVRAREGKADVIAVGSNKDIYGFEATGNLINTRERYSMTNLVTRVVIFGKEDSEGRPSVEAVVDGKTEYGVLQNIQTVGSSDLAEAQQKAWELLDDKGTPERTISVVAPEFPGIRKGDCIHINADGLRGYFHVKGIAHNATAMVMQMEVTPR